MSSGRRFGFAAILLLVAGCGGSTFDTASTGAGGSGTGGGSSGSGGAAETGGTTGSGGAVGMGGTGGSSSDAGALSCTDLLATAVVRLSEAQICIGNSTIECQSTVSGDCGCPVLVAHPDSAATQAYLNALSSYNTQCPHSCPAIACITPTGVCGKVNPNGVRHCERAAVDGG